MMQPNGELPTKKKSSRLREALHKLRSAATKTKDNLAENEDEIQLPPEFPLVNPRDPADVPLAPSPSVFISGSFSAAGKVTQEEETPSIAQAATHLALLEVFWRYKERFLQPVDDVKSFFGPAFGWPKTAKWEAANTEMLWKVVVEIAVGRFEAWWKIVGREMEGLKWEVEHGDQWMPAGGPSKKIVELPAEMLPPLDVLMVWHSFMLNPRCYYDDCFALGVPSMLSVAFPWEAIKSAVDLKTLEYTLPTEAEAFFKVSTNQHIDLITQLKEDSPSTPRLPHFEISCPKCDSEHKICITSVEPGSTGWTSPDFHRDCMTCGFRINHDALCAERLRQDIHQVVSGGPGIRGTFSPPFAQGTTTNTLLKQNYLPTPPSLTTHPTTASLVELLPTASTTASFYLPSSPLSSSSISLSSAVLRQYSFTDKMHHTLWLRSPSLPLTLSRARHKYARFFQLFARFPAETMVPTLDLDVFWHTHQLTPARYYYFCTAVAGRFIDHDDKLATDVLEGGFETTGKRYNDTFGEEYGGCFCWACEVERDEEGQEEVQRGRREKVRRRKRRQEWERRVRVAFWREVEARRNGSGEMVGLEGLEKVLKEGPRKKGR